MVIGMVCGRVWGLGWGRLVIMRGDPTGESSKSGAVNYMRWKMIPLLDGAGEK